MFSLYYDVGYNIMIVMKYCPSCKQELPEELFANNKSNKDGLSYYCRQCQNEKSRQWRSLHFDELAAEKREYRKEHPEKTHEANIKWRTTHRDIANAIHRKNRVNIRKSVFDMYGGKCSCCGESRYEFLTLDHVNGGGNKHRKKETYQQLLYRLKREGKSSEYRLLCYNCNCAIAYHGYCPHQVRSS